MLVFYLKQEFNMIIELYRMGIENVESVKGETE